MSFLRRYLLPAVLMTQVSLAPAYSADPAPTATPYQIRLRSRHAEATPTRTGDAQTGGGSIVVEQPDSNTIIVVMSGSAVVGSDCHQSAAGIVFALEQDVEIVPTRIGVRPPRIGMMGQVVGTLQVTDPKKCCTPCGTAEQCTATASLGLGDACLLSINVAPSAASCGQELSINHRDGPVEAVAAAGCYHLTGSFAIDVNQGKGVWHRQFAVADFDPAPQLDGFWADALKPFRAVPRRDFGFKVVVRVVEDAAAAAEAGAEKKE